MNNIDGDYGIALWRRVIKTPLGWCPATTWQTGRGQLAPIVD